MPTDTEMPPSTAGSANMDMRVQTLLNLQPVKAVVRGSAGEDKSGPAGLPSGANEHERAGKSHRP